MAFKPYESALRERVAGWIKRFDQADILVGLPCYNNEDTIAHVVTQAAQGLSRHFPELRKAILISDGGSTDDTRVAAEKAVCPEDVQRFIFIYRGLPGKGTSFRAVFEAARMMKARSVVVMDADLRSITPEWVQALARPVLEDKADFVAPLYARHKYDGTITNHIVYPMTRALYGRRLRQPIGGDFGFSGRMAEIYLSKDVWMTDIARFGIDIWMTTVALNEASRVGQTGLGLKIHDAKDPGSDLEMMFRQVVSTLFFMMSDYESHWIPVQGSQEVPLFDGLSNGGTIPPLTVNEGRLVREFKEGFEQFASLYREILTPEHYDGLVEACRPKAQGGAVDFGPNLWAGIVYDFAYTFHNWSRNRHQLVNIMLPLYFGRTAAYVEEVKGMSGEEAEAVIERQALIFEERKSYLRGKLDRWECI
jgi:hypothetical protein